MVPRDMSPALCPVSPSASVMAYLSVSHSHTTVLPGQMGVSWTQSLLASPRTPSLAPSTPFLAVPHVTSSPQTHEHFLTAARHQAWAGSTPCRAPHLPEGAVGAQSSSQGTAGTHPWEPPVLVADFCHPSSGSRRSCPEPISAPQQWRVPQAPSSTFLLPRGSGKGVGTLRERLMHCHAPSTVSQHLQGVSPTVVFSPQTIIGPGLWHIGQADGQESHFSRSVKLEGPCKVVGRIAQVHWPPGSQTQGVGRGRLGARRTQCSRHVRHT